MIFNTRIKIVKDYTHHAFKEHPFFKGEVYDSIAPIETDGVFVEVKYKDSEPFDASHLVPLPTGYFEKVDASTPLKRISNQVENAQEIKAQKSVGYIFLGILFIGLISMDLVKRLK
jgi:hypothetical protein